MSPEEREAFYDKDVAPVLMDLAGKCQANGVSLLATVEWDPGETGRTATLTADAGFGMRMVHAAMQSGNNVDSLIMALMRYGTEHGHSSACLHQLGVPTKPKTSIDSAVPNGNRGDEA